MPVEYYEFDISAYAWHFIRRNKKRPKRSMNWWMKEKRARNKTG